MDATGYTPVSQAVTASRLLMQGRFVPLSADVQNLANVSGNWVAEQMEVEPTYPRAYLRLHTNARMWAGDESLDHAIWVHAGIDLHS